MSDAAYSSPLGQLLSKYMPAPDLRRKKAPPPDDTAANDDTGAGASSPGQPMPEAYWDAQRARGILQGPSGSAGSPTADPLEAFMHRIYGGETGHDPDAYHRLYGAGGHFGFPQWSGLPGPAGTTHAAGAGQWEPKTWELAAKSWMAANPGEPAPDFNKPEDQDKLTKFWAAKTYSDATGGRDLKTDLTKGTLDPHGRVALNKQWPSLGMGDGGTGQIQSQILGAGQQQSELYQKAANEMRQVGQEALKSLADLHHDDPQFEKRIQEVTASADKATDALLKLTSEKPEPPLNDAIKNFGSTATLIGIAMGLLTRQPLTAALNAGTAAMGAATQGNWDRYKANIEAWKTQSDIMLRISELQNQKLRAIIEDHRQSIADRMAEAKAFMAANGMTYMATELEAKGPQGLMQALENMERITEQQQAHQDNLAMRLMIIGNQNTRAEQNKWSVVQDSDGTEYRYNAATNQATTLNGQPYTPKGAAAKPSPGGGNLAQYGEPPETISENPNKPTPGSNIPTSVWDGATQLALTGHMPVLGNSAAGRAAIQSALPWVLAARGMTPADMAQQQIAYTGALSGERTLGVRLANLNVGLAEMPHLGEQLVKASEATPRTESMDVNRLIQAFETRTGDPQIIRLGAAMNSYLQGYARAINPTGVITDDIRAHADHVLNQAMSKGQISAGVDQLNQELHAMQQGLREAAATGKTMFPLPGEPPPRDPTAAPPQGSVPIPKANHVTAGPNGQKIYSDDGSHWYDAHGIPVAPPSDGTVTIHDARPLPKGYEKYEDGEGFTDKNRPGGAWVKHGNELIWTPGAVASP